jgi:hypothetical protein
MVAALKRSAALQPAIHTGRPTVDGSSTGTALRYGPAPGTSATSIVSSGLIFKSSAQLQSRGIEPSNPTRSAVLDDEAGGSVRANVYSHSSSNQLVLRNNRRRLG